MHCITPALKHLNNYLILLQKQNSLLSNLLQVQHFDESILTSFTHYTQQYSALCQEYQPWLSLILKDWEHDSSVQQLLRSIEEIELSILTNTKALRDQLTVYQKNITQLLASAKVPKHSTPHYRYTQDDRFLDINA